MHFDLIRHPVVTSTMDVCRQLAERDAPEGTVVIAGEQTAGRGRAGRVWFSPPGQSLFVSILLRPQLAPCQIGWLTMIGALAVYEMVNEELSDEKAQSSSQLTIKWFNDVLLDGRKLAGVLVETSLTGDWLDYAVLGIGLNVNTRFDDAPEEIRRRATSLREAFRREFDREAVLQSLLRMFSIRYEALPASPVADYARRLDTLGKRVRLSAGEEIVEGEAVRVEEDGALIVVTEKGERVARFGDVA